MAFEKRFTTFYSAPDPRPIFAYHGRWDSTAGTHMTAIGFSEDEVLAALPPGAKVTPLVAQ